MKHIWNPLCLIFAAIVLAGGRTSSSCKSTKVELMVISTSPINFNGFFGDQKNAPSQKPRATTMTPRFGGWEAARAIFFAADFFGGEVCGGTSPRTSPHEKTQGSHVAVDDGVI